MNKWLMWSIIAIVIIVAVYFLMKANSKTKVNSKGETVTGLGLPAGRMAKAANKQIAGMNCTPVYNKAPDGTQWLAVPLRYACPNGGIFDSHGQLVN